MCDDHTYITTPKVPRLFLPSTLVSVLLIVPVLAPIPALVLIPVLVLVLVPVTVLSFPSLVSCSSLDTTSSGRRRVLRRNMLSTCRRHLLSIEMMMMPRTLLLPPSSFLLPPFPLHYLSLSLSDPAPSPSPSPFPLLPSFQSPLRPCSRLAFVLSSPPPFPFPLRPRPRPRPRPRSLLPVPRIWLPPRYNVNGAGGCPQAPLPVCRDDALCGMKGPAVKQEGIAADDVLLPFPPPDAGTRWVYLRPVLCPSDGELFNEVMTRLSQPRLTST